MSRSATTTHLRRRPNLHLSDPLDIDINRRPSKRRHLHSPSSTLLLSRPDLPAPSATTPAATPAVPPAVPPAIPPATTPAIPPAVGGIQAHHWLPNFYAAPAPASPRYLTRSSTYAIRPADRSVVVNWLMQLRGALGIATTTLYVSVTIMDRFLSTHPDIRLHLLQLLACACVFISVKTYETDVVLAAGRLVSLSGGAFDFNSLIHMESIVLNRLDFNIIAFTPLHALDTLAAHHHLAHTDTNTAKFAALIALTDHVCAENTPANNTLAAIHLAKTMALECGNENEKMPKPNVQVLDTARRIVVVWLRALKAHDKGDFNFAVRSHPLVSRLVLAPHIRNRIETTYAMDLSELIKKNIVHPVRPPPVHLDSPNKRRHVDRDTPRISNRLGTPTP